MFKITSLALSCTCSIDISADDYKNIKKSNTVITNVTHVERQYDTIIENYLELENELIRITSLYLMREKNTNSFLSDANLINRRIVNLLTACRMYHDQTPHILNVIFGRSCNEKEEFCIYRSSFYDENLEYRVMEGIRNYAQHRGHAVKSYTLASDRIKLGDEYAKRYGIILKLDFRSIDSDADYKKKMKNNEKRMLEDLRKINNSIDAKQHIRKYIECISLIHEKFRSLTSDMYLSSEHNVLRFRNLFKSECNEVDSSLIAALHLNADDEEIERQYLSLEWIEHRTFYFNRNKPLANLSSGYVTSEVIQ